MENSHVRLVLLIRYSSPGAGNRSVSQRRHDSGGLKLSSTIIIDSHAELKFACPFFYAEYQLAHIGSSNIGHADFPGAVIASSRARATIWETKADTND